MIPRTFKALIALVCVGMIIILVSVGLVAATGAAAFRAGRCAKDIDCRGRRICDEGRCRDQSFAEATSQELTILCSFGDEDIDSSTVEIEEDGERYRSLVDAQRITREILDVLGLAPNFVVAAADVGNAAAAIRGGTRFILCSPDFMKEMDDLSNGNWAATSIIAHELGHHFQGHTIRSGGSHHEIEIEADRYSGSLMRHLGATLEESQAAMNSIGSVFASDTHPDKASRLRAIRLGWKAADRLLATRRVAPRDADESDEEAPETVDVTL